MGHSTPEQMLLAVAMGGIWPMGVLGLGLEGCLRLLALLGPPRAPAAGLPAPLNVPALNVHHTCQKWDRSRRAKVTRE